jgi:hypothetical protein
VFERKFFVMSSSAAALTLWQSRARSSMPPFRCTSPRRGTPLSVRRRSWRRRSRATAVSTRVIAMAGRLSCGRRSTAAIRMRRACSTQGQMCSQRRAAAGLDGAALSCVEWARERGRDAFRSGAAIRAKWRVGRRTS